MEKELDRLGSESDRLDAQLTNKNFMDRAPKENVEKVKNRREEVRQAVSRLQKVLSDLK